MSEFTAKIVLSNVNSAALIPSSGATWRLMWGKLTATKSRPRSRLWRQRKETGQSKVAPGKLPNWMPRKHLSVTCVMLPLSEKILLGVIRSSTVCIMDLKIMNWLSYSSRWIPVGRPVPQLLSVTSRSHFRLLRFLHTMREGSRSLWVTRSLRLMVSFRLRRWMSCLLH